MKDFSKRLFRCGEKVELLRGDGPAASGRGLAVRLKGAAADRVGSDFHRLGELETPLYAFLGELPLARAGDELRVGGKAYRVLKGEEIFLGKNKVCLRALIERKAENDESV